MAIFFCVISLRNFSPFSIKVILETWSLEQDEEPTHSIYLA